MIICAAVCDRGPSGVFCVRVCEKGKIGLLLVVARCARITREEKRRKEV